MKAEKIEVKSTSFATLMSDMETGRIRVPKFQRIFVWEQKRIRQLLDSMYREYPIGTIFLWEAPTEYNHLLRTVDYLQQPSIDPYKSYRLILDGQQRLTSLHAVIKGLTIEDEDYSKIVFDLNSRDTSNLFKYREPDNQRFVAVRDVLASDLDIYENLLAKNYRIQFNICHKLLSKYPFSVVTVKDMDLESAIEIFERINRLGKKLTRYDLISANILTDEFDLRESTQKDVIKPLETFGKIEETSIVQSLALNIKDNVATITQMNLKADEVQSCWQDTVDSFKLAVEFVNQNLGVLRTGFLPYDAILPVLAYYFHHAEANGVISTEHCRQLKYWFWRAIFSERYNNHVQGRMSEDAIWIRDLIKEDKPYQHLTTIDKNALLQIPMTQARSAVKRGIFCLLNSQKPLHFENAAEINIKGDHFSKFNLQETHRIFPATFLKKQGYKTKDINKIPNFFFIPAELNKWISDKSPSEYMQKIKDEYGTEHFEKVMRSHLIPVDDNSGIWTDNYERFLKKRAELIVKEIRHLCGIEDRIVVKYRNPIIDKIETTLRDIIHEELSRVYGLDYWNKHIPKNVDSKISDRIDEDIRKTAGATKKQFDDARLRLNFCDIRDYDKIISHNWSNVFSAKIKSKTELKRYLDDLNDFRNATKHNRLIDDLLELRGRAAIIWFSRTMDIDLSQYNLVS